MNPFDTVLEFRGRELIAYLDEQFDSEEDLPLVVEFLVRRMRAALYGKAIDKITPGHRCRLRRRCRS
jgi:hypothetical protein